MTKIAKKIDNLGNDCVRILKIDKEQIEEIIHDYIIDNIEKLVNLDPCTIITHTIIDLKNQNVTVFCVNDENEFNMELNLGNYKSIALKLKETENVFDKKNFELKKLISDKQ